MTMKIKRRLSFKAVIWGQIVLQALFPLVSSFSVQASPSPPEQALPGSGTMSTVASGMANAGGDGLRGIATNMATGKAATTVEDWLSRFGTAKVNLSVDNDGNWDQSSIDLLTPIYDNKKSVWFTQLGLRAPDGRVTGNFGTGVRTFYTENWMFGGNVFFDDDFTGKNRRVGFGAEAWTNYLKLSANTYVGTTDWHDTRDFDDYYEKPADGFDIRAEGYLPAYPQLGAKVMYEKYYGNKVALFDTDHLQSNPSAVTMGVNYTPIPLVSLAANYRKGQDSMDDAQFQLNIRYDIGQNWRAQLDPNNVRAMRTLSGSRYDLVERNNQLILQYKKKDKQGVAKLSLQAITDNSPADGLAQNTLQVLATNRNNQPVPDAAIAWSSTGTAKLDTTAAVTNSQGIAIVNLTNTTPETVQIQAKSGSVTAALASHFNEVTVSHVVLAITKDGSAADGVTPNSAMATITDINNRPVANSKVIWSVSAPAVLKNAETVTDSEGRVRTQFTSTQPGPVTLKITAGQVNAQQQASFVSDAANAEITAFTISTDNSPADGVTPNIAQVTVKDRQGQPVANVNVTVTADKSTVAFRSAKAQATSTMQTDANGQVNIPFTDTVAETVTLTARLDNGNSKAVQSTFSANANSAVISSLIATTGAAANGTATNQATITVVDASNNPVANADVTWSIDGSAVLASPTSKTGMDGKAAVTFTDLKAEAVNITATLSNSATQSASSSFIADASTARITNLTVDSGAKADGVATNRAVVTVADANGNLLAGQAVSWSAENATGNVTFSPATPTTTDANGEAVVNISDNAAETITVRARLTNNDTQSRTSEFVQALTVTVTSDVDSVPAGFAGTDRAHLTATVTDGQGNPVAGETITWSYSTPIEFADGPTTATTGSDGKATISVWSAGATEVDIRATIGSGGNTVVGTKHISILLVRVSSLTPSTTSTATGNLVTLDAVIVDSAGTPLAGRQVKYTITSGNGGSNLGASTLRQTEQEVTVTADSSGHARAYLRSTVAGTITVSAKDAESQDLNPQSTSVTFISP